MGTVILKKSTLLLNYYQTKSSDHEVSSSVFVFKVILLWYPGIQNDIHITSQYIYYMSRWET